MNLVRDGFIINFWVEAERKVSMIFIGLPVTVQNMQYQILWYLDADVIKE